MPTKTTSKPKATPSRSPFRGAGRKTGKLIAPQEAGRLLLDHYIAKALYDRAGKKGPKPKGMLTPKRWEKLDNLEHEYYGADRLIYEDYQALIYLVPDAYMGHENFSQSVNFYLTFCNLDLMALLANRTVLRLERNYPIIMIPSQYEAWKKGGEKPTKPIAVVQPETMDPELFKRMDEQYKRFVMPTKFNVNADIKDILKNSRANLESLRISFKQWAAYRKAFELIAEVRQVPRILDLIAASYLPYLGKNIRNYFALLDGLLQQEPDITKEQLKEFRELYANPPIEPPIIAAKAIQEARTALEDPAYFNQNGFYNLIQILLGGVK